MPQVLIAGSDATGALNEMPLEVEDLADCLEIDIASGKERRRLLYLRSSKTNRDGLPVYEYSHQLPQTSTSICGSAGAAPVMTPSAM